MDRIGRRKLIAGAAALTAAPALPPATRARAEQRRTRANLATVGNSLIDQSVDMVHFLARSRGVGGTLGHQTIPGASMRWNWDHAPEAHTNGRALLAGGGQDLWMGVESVPFRHVQGRSDFCDVTAWTDWARLAADNGVTRIHVFEAWHDLRSGRPEYEPEDRADPDTGIPWRDRIEAARPHWEGIADHMDRARRPGDPPVVLIPGGAALAAIHDDIRRGKASAGLDSIDDLFADSIHPNPLGRYALACVMYACLYRRSPEGLTAATADVHGNSFGRVPANLAAYFQRTAWATARADERSGIPA